MSSGYLKYEDLFAFLEGKEIGGTPCPKQEVAEITRVDAGSREEEVVAVENAGAADVGSKVVEKKGEKDGIGKKVAVHLSQLGIGEHMEGGIGAGGRKERSPWEMKERVRLLGVVMKKRLDDCIAESVEKMEGVVLSEEENGASFGAISSLQNDLKVLGMEKCHPADGMVECVWKQIGELRGENVMLKGRLEMLEMQIGEVEKARLLLLEMKGMLAETGGEVGESCAKGELKVEKGSPVTPKTKEGGSRLRRRRKEGGQVAEEAVQLKLGVATLTGFRSAAHAVQTAERILEEQRERRMGGMGSRSGARRVYENGESCPRNFHEMTFEETETQDPNA